MKPIAKARPAQTYLLDRDDAARIRLVAAQLTHGRVCPERARELAHLLERAIDNLIPYGD